LGRGKQREESGKDPNESQKGSRIKYCGVKINPCYGDKKFQSPKGGITPAAQTRGEEKYIALWWSLSAISFKKKSHERRKKEKKLIHRIYCVPNKPNRWGPERECKKIKGVGRKKPSGSESNSNKRPRIFWVGPSEAERRENLAKNRFYFITTKNGDRAH